MTKEPKPGEMIPAHYQKRESWRDCLPEFPTPTQDTNPAKVGEGVTIKAY